jgi:hypothetical protein
MTLPKDVFEGHSTDELGRLLRWALYDSVGRSLPPSRVWREIKQKIQRRTASRGGRRYALGGGFYRPTVIFGAWQGCGSPSLVYIVEQQMSSLCLGWAI